MLGETTSALSPYIANLVDLGFLEKQVPVTEKNPEKSRKGLCFTADNFVRFWFYYVYPYKGELELGNRQIVLDEMGKDFAQAFVVLAYEEVCSDVIEAVRRRWRATRALLHQH